jgi:hypothetical protein
MFASLFDRFVFELSHSETSVILLSNPESHDFDFTYCRGYERPAKPVPGDCGYYLHAHQLVLSHPTKNEVGIQ